MNEVEIPIVDRELAIKIAPGASRAQTRELLGAYDASFRYDFDDIGWAFLEFPEGRDVVELQEKLRKHPSIQAVTLNVIGQAGSIPNDTHFDKQWALKNTGQENGTPGADINVVPAWDITRGDTSVVIAILDKGIDYDSTNSNLEHEDLIDPDRILIGYNYIDDNTNVTDASDGHGTEVTGIAAAETNNNKGIAGVAGGAQVLVMKVAGGTKDDSTGVHAFYKATIDAADHADSTGKRMVINVPSGEWEKIPRL